MSTVNNNPEENKIITETSSSSTSSTALEGWNFDSKPKSPVSTGVVKAGVMSKDSKFDEYKKVAEEKKKRDEILKRPETKNPSPSGKKISEFQKYEKISQDGTVPVLAVPEVRENDWDVRGHRRPAVVWLRLLFSVGRAKMKIVFSVVGDILGDIIKADKGSNSPSTTARPTQPILGLPDDEPEGMLIISYHYL